MTSGPAQVFIRELLIRRVRTADVFYVNGKGLMCTRQKKVPPYRNELFFRKIIAKTLTCESLCFFTAWFQTERHHFYF